ncbi:MAG: DNA polymerase III subunit delta' C-terminal domain-containing protein [Clostridia bacterium]|nr:DNA polymerase III subunit delta' C-terminal domain-containing protein [Clostridia bacterium]
MNFNQIAGHEKIIEHLKTSIIHNRINHAYIFDGIKGVGKKTLSKAFAKALNCCEGSADACNHCISCKTFDENNNPDIIYVTHQKRDITVADIREQIVKNITLKPYRNKYKIFIIPEADKMNVLAQNAFLKTLEEPPEYGIFLLLCENYNKFLVTILSRCIMFKLHPLPYTLVSDYLIKNSDITLEQAQLYSIYSQGSIGKAMELINSDEFRDTRDLAIETAVKLEDADMIELYRLVDDLKEHRPVLDQILEIMYLVYRDSLVLKQTGCRDKIIQKDKLIQTETIAKKAAIHQLINRCDSINDTRNKLSHNGNAQLLLETLFYKIKEK